jgi:hypothetical protein
MRRRLTALFPLVLALTVVTVVGCASAKFTDWTGHHIDEVIKEFGPATRVVPAADGGKMYVWEYERTTADSRVEGTAQQPRVVNYLRRYTATKTFLVRPDGIIASWNFQD